ncbi:hypothetical protein GCM10010260_12610 [Streptomyces filipinensis]|uniref:Uncharacterized protein n=1 Tax=Streptomyces filipinensis TaxID=66887 RepID=A0A918I721_9ACTN|nr:hypothetical protein GCM10010260_12610 [Streptomyces filipinensis]
MQRRPAQAAGVLGRTSTPGGAEGVRYLTRRGAHSGRHFTGRWYATRYRSAGITTSAVSTGRPEA